MSAAAFSTRKKRPHREKIVYTESESGACVQVSFILITKNEGRRLRDTLAQLVSDLPEGAEVVVLDDASTDESTLFLQTAPHTQVRLLRAGGLGVARARNAAALQARGEILIFLDAHMNLPRGWWQPVAALLASPSVGAAQPCIAGIELGGNRGYGERFKGADLTLEWLPRTATHPYQIPILCGCCFAVRRDLFLRVGGLDGGMIGWGSEDCEFSVRLWRLGYEVWIEPRVVVGHLFRTQPPYHVNWYVVLHNRLRLALAHFSEARIDRIAAELKRLPEFRQAWATVTGSDVSQARQWLERNCLRDDGWFLQCSGKKF